MMPALAGGKLLLFALAVTALTGLVDAAGFLAFGRLFLASPDAGSIVASVALIDDFCFGLIAGGLILTFLVGVVASSLAAARFPRHRRSIPLLGVGCLLTIAFLAETTTAVMAAVAAAMAMGAAHGLFGEDEPLLREALLPSVQIVRFGEALARPKADRRSSMARHAALWIAFLVGALVGVGGSVFAPGRSLALAAVLALLLVLIAVLLDRRAAGKIDSN